MPDSPIIAQSTGSPVQAVRYVLARPHGEYSDESVDTIVRAYWAQCAAVGVDPVMVVAQLIHETGGLAAWWAQRPRRNPAGIGVTGHSVSREAFEASPARYPDRSWAWGADGRRREGCSFGSWAGESVPAHVGRLLAYALPAGQGTIAQQALIAVALRARALPASYRGAAPTWRGLDGRWAVPGTVYSDRTPQGAESIINRCVVYGLEYESLSIGGVGVGDYAQTNTNIPDPPLSQAKVIRSNLVESDVDALAVATAYVLRHNFPYDETSPVLLGDTSITIGQTGQIDAPTSLDHDGDLRFAAEVEHHYGVGVGFETRVKLIRVEL